MTRLEIVDGILELFTEGHRTMAESAVNLRYGQLWSLERWTFRLATDDVQVTAGSPNVSGLPPDFGRAVGLWNAQGDKLRSLQAPTWHDFYQADVAAPTSGAPEAFTVIGGAVLVGPPSNETSALYKLLYLRKLTLLNNDSDVPAFPEEYHYLLVHGGQATMQAATQDPAAALNEQAWLNGLELMRRDYLAAADTVGEQWGSSWWGVMP